jgi:hypothetical protein
VLDRIRNRFPWLELIWADSGYHAHQVDAAVANNPTLRLEIIKRSDDRKASSCCRAAGSWSEPSPGSAATAASPRISRTSPNRSSPSSPSPVSRSQSVASRDSCLLSQALRLPRVFPACRSGLQRSSQMARILGLHGRQRRLVLRRDTLCSVNLQSL